MNSQTNISIHPTSSELVFGSTDNLNNLSERCPVQSYELPQEIIKLILNNLFVDGDIEGFSSLSCTNQSGSNAN